MKRKSIIAVGMAALMSIALLAGCGSNGSEPQSVSTNGSTSMEKVIGALSEKFMETNKDITVTYDPTGSGTGIESVSTGKCDIGLSSRALKDSETGLTGTTIALDGIKAVTVGGVACSEATVLDGSYAIQRPFVLVTKDGTELSSAAKAFFDFATSTDAADLIRNAGAVPAAK